MTTTDHLDQHPDAFDADGSGNGHPHRSTHSEPPVQAPRRMATYCRVNPGDASIDRQRDAVHEFTRSLAHLPVDTFEDDGASGNDLGRPGLNALLEAVRSGEYAIVVVYNLSRLARVGIDTILAELGAHSIDLYQVIDGPTPMPRHLMSFVADQNRTAQAGISERDVVDSPGAQLAEQARAAHGARVAEGHRVRTRRGDPPRLTPFGMHKVTAEDADDERARLVPDENPADHLNGTSPADAVREMFRLKLQGNRCRQIAVTINAYGWTDPRGDKWNADLVLRTLVNPSLVGWQVYDNEVVLGDDGEPITPHAPLLDLEQWNQIRLLLTPFATVPAVPFRRRLPRLT